MGDRLLAIDTATPACSVALFEQDHLVASEYEEIGRGHAEKLVPMIASLPGKGRADQILVNCGPGSFTGVRIGLSAARALAMAWNAKLAGYQCLSLVAAQAQDFEKEPVYVMMNGGHGEYFVQNFSAGGDAIDDLLSIPAGDAANNAKAKFFAGSAADQIAANRKTMLILPDASKCLLLSLQNRGLEITPIYGRSPDAQPAQVA